LAEQQSRPWESHVITADDPKTRAAAHAWLDAQLYEYIQNGAHLAACDAAR